MTKQRRIKALVLAFFVIFAMTTSLFVIVHEADHDCIGENCAVCAVVALCENTIKVLCGALVAIALLIVCGCFHSCTFLAFYKQTYCKTLVSLKIKLLN